MSVAIARCRLCRKTTGELVADPSLGTMRIKRGRLDTRQTFHHQECLYDATGLIEMPYPPDGATVERARQRRKWSIGREVAHRPDRQSIHSNTRTHH